MYAVSKNRISLIYVTSQLLRNQKIRWKLDMLKDTVTAKYAASKIVEFVKQVMSGDTPVILVAHNGNSFDHDRLLSFLERSHELYELSESFPETLFFGDSLPTVRKLKTKLDLPSCKLSDVYRKFFAEDFAASSILRVSPPCS